MHKKFLKIILVMRQMNMSHKLFNFLNNGNNINSITREPGLACGLRR